MKLFCHIVKSDLLAVIFFDVLLDLIIKDGVLSANGTTLGGDNGAAVACMLAILDDDTLTHPALECVFTTQEEIGLNGAEALDKSFFQLVP